MPIMAVGAQANGRVLMLGLNHMDIAQLLQGEPIQGSLERCLNIQGLRLMVFVGPTDAAMKEVLGSVIPTVTLPRDATGADLDKLLEKDHDEALAEIEQKFVKTLNAPVTHILLYGEAFCRFSVLAPADWPEGHAWVRDLDELTSSEVLNPCPICLEKAKKEH